MRRTALLVMQQTPSRLCMDEPATVDATIQIIQKMFHALRSPSRLEAAVQEIDKYKPTHRPGVILVI